MNDLTKMTKSALITLITNEREEHAQDLADRLKAAAVVVEATMAHELADRITKAAYFKSTDKDNDGVSDQKLVAMVAGGDVNKLKGYSTFISDDKVIAAALVVLPDLPKRITSPDGLFDQAKAEALRKASKASAVDLFASK